MTRPCSCDRFRVANGAVMMPPAPGECETCIAFAVDPVRRTAWGGDGNVMRMAMAAPPAPAAKRSPAPARKPKRTALPLLPPCKWEGSITSACTTCGNKERNHERQCTHPGEDAPDVCTRGNEKSTLTRCNACPQYERDDAPLIQLSAPAERPLNADRARIAARLREQVTRLPVYPDPTPHHGRGIVTVAGGARYFACGFVLLSLLRRHGCTLPVEVWHLDEGEMDDAMRGLLEAFGNVRVVNAEHVALSLPEDERPKRLQGWECKAFAIQHSAFREVLFLDADQLPARDPSDLFDAPQFRDTGAVFWPDFEPEGWRVSAAAFRIAGLPVPEKTRKPDWRHPTDYDAWETGQILIDKSRHWPALRFWQWFGDDAAFWYSGVVHGKGKDLVYGDKDTAYLAWRLLGLPFAMPRKSDFIGRVNHSGAFVQHDFAGEPVFYHRVQPQSKFSLHGENPPLPGCPVWPMVEDALAALRAAWSMRPYDAKHEPPDAAEPLVEWWLCRGDEPAAPIMLRPNRTVTGGPGITRWTTRRDHRGELLVLANGERGVYTLGRDTHGNYVNHGRNAFLVPAPPAGIHLPLTRHDAVVAHSVLRLNEYRYPDRFPPGSVVLDIGSHCGLSVRAALDRGAAHVVAVEPAPGNLEYLRRNFGDDPDVTILPVAAWPASPVRLAPGVVKCANTAASAGWTVHESGTLEAAAVPLADLLATAAAKSPNGRVAMLKLDCEGAEWVLLDGADLSCVDAIAGEYHGAGRAEADTPERLAAMLGDGWTTEIFPHAEAARLGILTARRA